jgi:hypothetical protein
VCILVANLNVFIAAWIALAVVVRISPVLLAITEIVRLTLGTEWIAMAIWLAPIVLSGIVVIVVWVRYGLSPASRPDRRRRYRVGHVLVGAFNLVALTAALSPLISPDTGARGVDGLVVFLVLVLAFLVCLTGLALILSSRVDFVD